MTEERRHTLTIGRNIGAAVGVVVFLVFGLVPAFHFGSYGTLVIISDLAGGPVEPGVLVRIALVVGVAISFLCIGALSIVAGSVIGTALAYVVDIISTPFVVEKGYEEDRLVIGRPAAISEGTRSQILSRLSFISSRSHEIHSIVLIGSAAYGIQEEGSDMDIVIICKDKGFDSFREFLFDKEIEGFGKSDSGRKFEFTVLDFKNAKKYFRITSPFAYAISNGVILRDDGHLRKLIKRNDLAVPGREYYMSAFYENISVQYYGSLDKIEREIKRNQCSDECCAERKDCGGLSRGDDLAKTVMRMLYVTLPARGFMPLSKRDALEYAEKTYGEDISEPLRKVVEMMREENGAIYYSDYKLLKPVAVKLFREILSVVGLKQDVLRILKNAARLIRGDYSKIDDEALKKCVI
jgi:predicted nucleotidyltransferase